MTAIEWLIGRFHFEGFIGTYCDEEQIKSKRQLMIEIIEQAKEMEKRQIILAHGIKDTGVNNMKCVTGEQYYNETYKNTNNETRNSRRSQKSNKNGIV